MTKGEFFDEDPHIYEHVGNEIRRDDGVVFRLAPITDEDRAWARAQLAERKQEKGEDRNEDPDALRP